ncbi:MAG: hypothetical protein JO356_00510 [Acidobacteria bacterium]|nr:hypothetical protein [Acidobacteriota bacterium]
MGTLRKKNLLFVAVIILLLLAAGYLWGPVGGNLSLITPNNFAAQFKGQFDGAANDARVLLLLSPT